MQHTDFKKLLSVPVTRKEFLGLGVLAVATAFGLVGLLRELSSKAASNAVDIEPEDGTLQAGATVKSDATASGGKAVQFGSVAASTMPLTNPAGWVRTFQEDFNYNLPVGSLGETDIRSDRTLVPGSTWYNAFGTKLKWFENASWNTGEKGRYWNSRTLSVANSALRIRNHSQIIPAGSGLPGAGTRQYLGAGFRVMQAAGGGQAAHSTGGMIGGRVEMRARATNVVSTGNGWGGVLLYIGAPNQADQTVVDPQGGDSHWPRLGELDFPEGNFNDSIHGFHHWAREIYRRYPDDKGEQTVISKTPGGIPAKYWTDGWHIVSVEWMPRTTTQPGYVDYKVDGVTYLRTETWVPWHRLPLSFQCGKATADPIADTSEITFEIDWIVSWVPASIPGQILPGTLKA
jgi:hypothetical protein